MRWRRGTRRRGFVLIAVLIVIMVLSVVLMETNYATRLGLRAAENRYRARQALACADAGLEVAMAALVEADAAAENEALRKLLGGTVKLAVGEGSCAVRATPETGKFNVNTLVPQSGRGYKRAQVEQLLRIIDTVNRAYGDEAPVSYGIAAALVDWIDRDENVTHLPFVSRGSEGAESSHYESGDRPHKCKNAPVDTISELLLVRDVTPEVFNGRPAKKEAEKRAAPGLRSLLTVYGDGKVDLNHAPPEVLRGLSPLIDADVAQAIVAAREDRPFESLGDLRRVSGITPRLLASIRGQVTVKPTAKYYRVVATGAAGGMKRVVEAVVRRDKDGFRVVLREER